MNMVTFGDNPWFWVSSVFLCWFLYEKVWIPMIRYALIGQYQVLARELSARPKKACRYTIYHEVGHILMNAAFKEPDSCIMVSASATGDKRGRLGYAVMHNVNNMPQTRELNEWLMLSLLAGYMAERKLFGEESLGSGDDLEGWSKVAKFHLESGFCDGFYYSEPANHFEFDSNQNNMKKLMDKQQDLLRRFFDMNVGVLKEVGVALEEEGVLTRGSLMGYLGRVVFPDDFPMPELAAQKTAI